jgi:hypothetical protein
MIDSQAIAVETEKKLARAAESLGIAGRTHPVTMNGRTREASQPVSRMTYCV